MKEDQKGNGERKDTAADGQPVAVFHSRLAGAASRLSLFAPLVPFAFCAACDRGTGMQRLIPIVLWIWVGAALAAYLFQFRTIFGQILKAGGLL